MTFVFDSIIFFILFFSGYWIYIISRSFFITKENPARTKIVRIFILILLSIILLTVFWGSFIEPRRLTVKTININLNKTPAREEIKIALLADFHVGAYKKNGYIEQIVGRVEKINPDIIAMSGDFILGRAENAKYLFPLQRLSSKYPTFSATGNHEYSLASPDDPELEDKTWLLRQLFEKWEIKMLDNESRVVDLGAKGRFNIAGIFEIWTGWLDLNKAAQNLNPELPAILLAHNPDVILKQDSKKFNLILSGHTHAGQICLPWLGSIPSLPTELGRKYSQGLFKLKNNGYLYITAGLGETGPRARLFNRPEITLINLDL